MMQFLHYIGSMLINKPFNKTPTIYDRFTFKKQERDVGGKGLETLQELWMF